MKNKIIIGFMDKVDFDYELGNDLKGNKIYPSIKSLIENTKHSLGGCGIVKVKVELEETILESDLRISEKEQEIRMDELLEQINKTDC